MFMVLTQYIINLNVFLLSSLFIFCINTDFLVILWQMLCKLLCILSDFISVRIYGRWINKYVNTLYSDLAYTLHPRSMTNSTHFLTPRSFVLSLSWALQLVIWCPGGCRLCNKAAILGETKKKDPVASTHYSNFFYSKLLEAVFHTGGTLYGVFKMKV